MDSAGRAHVLITFGRSFLTLELARLMAAGGHRVSIADSIPVGIGRFSNAVDGFHRVPPPKFEPLAYCRALARIVAENDVDMVIPVHEETDIIAMLAETFPPECRLFLSDFSIENRLHNKYEFQELLVELGIPTRKFARVTGPEDAAALDFEQPFALKRCYSRGSQKVHKVNPGDPLTWLEHDELNPWIAQEWASGKNYCTYSVCHEGRVYAHATYPVDYAIDGSSCLNFRSVDHPRIFEWVSDFVRRVNFTGQIGFDFIEDRDSTGAGAELFCIECNPRATSGIMMFTPADGVDRAILGTSDPDAGVITPGSGVDKMIGLGMLLYGWRSSSRKDRTVRDFLRDFRGASDVVTRRGDQKPALMLPFAYAGILRSCLKYRVGLAEGFMHDHEWDGLRISL
ncbi:ATP-grasp domain-containing protein [Gordonia jinghuaiqii]|uniref:ATP-grasp domain-containing protein n=1 Tax=Gordonia jinghuaiqii TaxID=2758710 RepID=A0A7D7LR56_9ACTN|nr:ATP-grasp domain-containing protein [Gordonia jinghuaiqii]MCR5978300.1 ATP-grasp domain-containing protein [Gordonia jinghuaiqii]QMT01260.1 ATP-grasp domain-containing protein [Gordonia jinghuaiqii]